MKHYVYFLEDPFTGKVRYVGVTARLKARLAEHMYKTWRPGVGQWIASLKAIGEKPILNTVEEIDNATMSDINEAEAFWLSFLLSSGADVLNRQTGGRGGYRPMADTLHKMRLSQRKSPEVREKIRLGLIKMNRSKGSPIKGRTKSESHRAALSESLKRRNAQKRNLTGGAVFLGN
jgi:hypothetical protein